MRRCLLVLALVLVCAPTSRAHWQLISDPPTEYCFNSDSAGAGTIAKAEADGAAGGVLRGLAWGGKLTSRAATAQCGAADAIYFKWNTENKPPDYPESGKVQCEASIDVAGQMFLYAPSANFSLNLASRFRCPLFQVKAKLDEAGQYKSIPSGEISFGIPWVKFPLTVGIPVPGPGAKVRDYFGPECDWRSEESCLEFWFEEKLTTGAAFVWAGWGLFEPGRIDTFAASVIEASANLLPCER